MLDRSAPNLFQDELAGPPSVPAEEAGPRGVSAAPEWSSATDERNTSTSPHFREYRVSRARAAWRMARRSLVPLLVVLALYRLVAGSHRSPIAPAPSPITPRPPAPGISTLPHDHLTASERRLPSARLDRRGGVALADSLTDVCGVGGAAASVSVAGVAALGLGARLTARRLRLRGTAGVGRRLGGGGQLSHADSSLSASGMTW
jgi:hypothetical protein